MSEWFKVSVLKTEIFSRISGVRILLHPKLHSIDGVTFDTGLTALCCISLITPNASRVFSSVGRAIRLQRKGHWFKSNTTQLFEVWRRHSVTLKSYRPRVPHRGKQLYDAKTNFLYRWTSCGSPNRSSQPTLD